MTIQDTGGTRKTIEQGMERIKAMLPLANQVKRETMPASELCSRCNAVARTAIRASPPIRRWAPPSNPGASWRHAILSETPEIYGAEHLLTRRAANREVGEKLVERIQWWEDYTARTAARWTTIPRPATRPAA